MANPSKKDVEKVLDSLEIDYPEHNINLTELKSLIPKDKLHMLSGDKYKMVTEEASCTWNGAVINQSTLTDKIAKMLLNDNEKFYGKYIVER